MEGYNAAEHGYADTYLIQATGSNPQLTSPFEHFEAMYNEGSPEFIFDQGLYYPTATNYGYICTGFDSPCNWDDHQNFLGQDGQDVQYAGVRTETLPYVYYSPNYGYAQSPYNPYNPYIPGAMIGVDGPYMGTQQYYTIPSYEAPVSSPAYFPMVVQPRPDIQSTSSVDSFLDTTSSTGSRLKNNLSPAAATFILTSSKPATSKATLGRVSEGPEVNAGPSKLSVAHVGVSSAGLPGAAKPQKIQGKSPQLMNDGLHGNTLTNHDQLKVVIPSGDGRIPNYGPNASGRTTIDKVRSKFYQNRVPNDINSNGDALTEQNRGPRTNKLKEHLTVKAYTSTMGDHDSQGNIIIHTDQYNRDDFPVDYVNAKFFVIKSYSEDDVHKSVKYNVWSSTPNGNKKLNAAYEDSRSIAAGDPKGCPVFLFFSVNASGQFCGVAEMIGSVDFHTDMDFWQQDKWSGCFPVKWHIIKDVPNPNFRHILLENNENKPVTNSRDTQEIRYKKGMDMLKIFKNYTAKTSLLDDFMYYESRQKLMQEEKARVLFQTFQGPILVPVMEQPPEPKPLFDFSNVDFKVHEDRNRSKVNVTGGLVEQVSNDPVVRGDVDNVLNEKADDSALKIGLLTISPNQEEPNQLEAAGTAVDVTEAHVDPVDVVTVGSMPVKVNNGFKQSAGFLTIGTIRLDPRSLQVDG